LKTDATDDSTHKLSAFARRQLIGAPSKQAAFDQEARKGREEHDGVDL